MAKTIIFEIGGNEYMVEPEKVDRKKLYGYSEVRAFDDSGSECTLVSTDLSGTVIIPKGGTGLALIAESGKWVERAQLTTVTADGSPATVVASSYSAANKLTRKATDEELLDCSITACYHLAGAGAALITAIGSDIYTFDYCYRDSCETSPAFLLTAEADGGAELFMLVGVQNEFTFIGLTEAAVADDTDTDDDEEESDDIDFGMM
jgi:hypothetical protein